MAEATSKETSAVNAKEQKAERNRKRLQKELEALKDLVITAFAPEDGDKAQAGHAKDSQPLAPDEIFQQIQTKVISRCGAGGSLTSFTASSVLFLLERASASNLILSLQLAAEILGTALDHASKFSKRQRQKLLKTLTEIRLEVTSSREKEEREPLNRKRKREEGGEDHNGVSEENEERERASEGKGGEIVQFLSFGHRHGLPLGAWKVYDVRSVPNVGKVLRRNSTGLQGSLERALFEGKHKDKVLARYQKMLRTLQIHVQKLLDEQKGGASEDVLKSNNSGEREEGDVTHVIAIGCASGKHRSVAFVERVSAEPCWTAMGLQVRKEHRDIFR